jgi:protein involved in polysaccharide export with SLBB domain
VDPAVQHILEALCEQTTHQQKQLASMAQIVEQLTDIVVNFSTIADRMRTEIVNMKGELALPELGMVEVKGEEPN